MYPRAPASSAWRTKVCSGCMLSIRTMVSGNFSRIRRVASRPLMPGRAQSIKITRGRSFSDRRMASSPSPASPATAMSGSSSSMRRNPRRTRLWSSTNKTEILSGMRVRFLSWNLEAHQRATELRFQKLNSTAQQFCTLAHRNQAYSLFNSPRFESRTVIFHLELQTLRQELQANPSLTSARMPRDVIQCFLQNAIDMNGGVTIHQKRFSRFLIGYVNPGLPFDRGNIPIESTL